MRASPHDIDVYAVAEMRADGAPLTLLDVREPAEVAICVIGDSVTIPLAQLERQITGLPRDHPLIVVCHHGMRSAMATDFLRSRGFDNAWNLAGGIDAWAQLVEPDMPRY